MYSVGIIQRGKLAFDFRFRVFGNKIREKGYRIL